MLNKVTLMGRVGKDPEVRSLQNGGKVASFSLATSETWKDKSGEKQERTQWHNIVVWVEGLVGVVDKYVAKGDLIYLEGQIETRKWEDQSGQDRYTTEVVLRPFRSELKLMPKGTGSGGGDRGRDDDDGRGRDRGRDRRDDRGGGKGGGRSGGRERSYAEDLDDEIPF